MIKRYGGAVLPGKVYRRRPGVYSILMRDGAILITHQFEPKPEFQLPGGGIDPGESPSAALHREVMEETGWHIANLRRLGVFRRFTHMPEYGFWAEKICTVYTPRPALHIRRRCRLFLHARDRLPDFQTVFLLNPLLNKPGTQSAYS